MVWDLGNDEITAGTDISPNDWQKEIEGLAREKGIKIDVDLITVENYFDRYNAIINPYGGVYPEKDIKTMKIQNKILNYVSEGGLFVNVAEILGYYAYNAYLDRRLDTTPPIYGIVQHDNGSIDLHPSRPFELTPFIKELGLRIYNVEKAKISDWKTFEFEERFKEILGSEISGTKVHRVVKLEKNVEAIV